MLYVGIVFGRDLIVQAKYTEIQAKHFGYGEQNVEVLKPENSPRLCPSMLKEKPT
jgi:hypothetical protein